MAGYSREVIDHIHQQVTEPNLPEDGRRRRIIQGRTVYCGSLQKFNAMLENDDAYPHEHKFFGSNQFPRIKEKGEDRAGKKRKLAFNEFPDYLLSIILSSFSDASWICKAATLSKQLMRVWAKLKTHTFVLEASDNPPLSFLRRHPPSSKKMTIRTWNIIDEDERLDFLVSSAAENQIEKLTLCFGINSRNLPDKVYSMSSLKSLKTTKCVFNMEAVSLKWNHLVSLQIFRGEKVKADIILENCHSLQILELSEVSLYSGVIEHKKLQSLKIENLRNDDTSEIVIITPNLKEMVFSGTWFMQICKLEDVCQLKRVWFDFRMCWYMNDITVQRRLFRELFIDLVVQLADHVEVNIGVISEKVLDGLDSYKYI